MKDINDQISACTACRNHLTRTKTVPGAGNPKARILVIGEGPGADEDASGLPFQGDAGQNLNGILQVVGLDRQKDLFITNIVKCRPVKHGKRGHVNRPPHPQEVQACWPFLLQQIEAISPEVIITMGRPATQLLLQSKENLKDLMSRPQSFNGIPVIPTYHTSDRNLNTKPECRGIITETFAKVKSGVSLTSGKAALREKEKIQ